LFTNRAELMVALDFRHSGLNKSEWSLLSRLDTPAKVQNFLDTIPFNFELSGETIKSVRYSLATREIHCFEGALIAAAALWIQGRPPLLMDLVSLEPDYDHVLALFKQRGKFGAVSKTNHSVLRYRDPIYRDERELAMSYFHEYFLDSGIKTLRQFSIPFDLRKFGTSWLISEENLFDLSHALDTSSHKKVISTVEIKGLRKADKILRQVTNLTEWPRRRGK
jgi:hypothetical protein